MKGDPAIAFDRTRELLEKNVKVDAFVCLEAIACPEVAEVLERGRITGKVVVAMDTDQRTLEAIQKGSITATVAQKPYTMAFVGLKLLDDLHHHPPQSLTANFAQDSLSPLPSVVDTGITLVDKGNVEQFMKARSAATSGK
jgi:ribose transport system substrate-binding protein